MGSIYNQHPRFIASKTSTDEINNNDYASLINFTTALLDNFDSLVNSNTTAHLTKPINSSITEHKYYPSSLISCNNTTTKTYDAAECENRTQDLHSKEDRNVATYALLGLLNMSALMFGASFSTPSDLVFVT